MKRRIAPAAETYYHDLQALLRRVNEHVGWTESEQKAMSASFSFVGDFSVFEEIVRKLHVFATTLSLSSFSLTYFALFAFRKQREIWKTKQTTRRCWTISSFCFLTDNPFFISFFFFHITLILPFDCRKEALRVN